MTTTRHDPMGRGCQSLRRPLLVTAVALLSGCAAVPSMPARPVPLAADGVAATKSLTAPSSTTPAAWPGEGWWRDYGDPQLDALIGEGLAGSPDIAAAVARLDRAAAAARQTGAARLPQVDLQGGVREEKQSLNMGFPPAFKTILPQGWYDAGQIAGSLGFDLDLWGRNRALFAAATSQQRAAALDLAQARLLLTVAIASAYVDLDRLHAERDIRQAQLTANEQTRQLAQQRQSSGLETNASSEQASAAVSVARIALSQAEEALVVRRNQLAALVGSGPDRGLALTRPALSGLVIRDLPANATTALLARRPDVIAARERVSASDRGIAAARAEFFPAITLSALFGTQSIGLESLFASDSSYGRVGPAVSLPIFHGGALVGRYRGARADYDAAVASYNGIVLAAYQQTADAVAASRLAADRVAEAKSAVAASVRAYDTIMARYKAGLVTYLDVLQVEDRLLAARMAQANVSAAARGTDLALVRALGGGFTLPAGAAGPVSATNSSMKERSHG